MLTLRVFLVRLPTGSARHLSSLFAGTQAKPLIRCFTRAKVSLVKYRISWFGLYANVALRPSSPVRRPAGRSRQMVPFVNATTNLNPRPQRMDGKRTEIRQLRARQPTAGTNRRGGVERCATKREKKKILSTVHPTDGRVTVAGSMMKHMLRQPKHRFSGCTLNASLQYVASRSAHYSSASQ